MPTIDYSVDIAATPDRVWHAVVDVERWPEIVSHFAAIELTSEGAFGLGSEARVRPKGFFGSTWTVTGYEEGRSFSWESELVPGMRFLADHSVEATEKGARLALSLSYTGLLATLLSPVLGAVFSGNVRREGDGIKAYCEGTSS